eukprot:m.3963 g.3963  ORF g.3963 m.3963 type:complete len:115 (-) comp3779_c0_seq1:397-741(-)
MEQMQISSASVWSRPKQTGPDLAGHWGVVVKNRDGDWLIHNTPASGVVVTPARYMSSKWSKQNDIPVVGKKNIRGCLRSTNGAASTYVTNTVTRYIMGATCIGTFQAVVRYLTT